VLHLSHLVHVDERIEIREVDARERAADGESLSLQDVRRDHHVADGALARALRGRGETIEAGEVVDGDGRHRELLVVKPNVAVPRGIPRPRVRLTHGEARAGRSVAAVLSPRPAPEPGALGGLPRPKAPRVLAS